MPGKLIVIEGLDGSGKSTQTELLSKRLTGCGVKHLRIKLPDYNSPASAPVRMYLAGNFGSDPSAVNAYAASSFFAVDRVASYLTRWREFYLGGGLVISDRYTTSNACYQLEKLPREQWDAYIDWLEDYEFVKLALPRPDAVVYLDMPVEVSQRLMSERYSGDENKKDIHEANVAFLNNCREAALFAAKKSGWKVISCARDNQALSVDEVERLVFDSLEKELFDD